MEESINKTVDNNMKEKKSSKDSLRVFQFISILFLLIIGVLSYLLYDSYQSLDEKTDEVQLTLEENITLQTEFDGLLKDYTTVKHQYDSVLVDKDEQIQEMSKEIEQLLAQQADYWRIRRQLELLRDITQNYVREIDSLHTENRVLKAENVRMHDEIQRVTEETVVLSQTKVELEEKVEKAATLRAFQISATGLRFAGFSKRERETDKARRVEQIRTCFTIAENPIAPAGNKNVYLRIADPHGEILRISDDERYSFVFQEDTLQFSVSEDINYQNTNMEMCLNWNTHEELIPGQYIITLFTDDAVMGETLINLN